MRTILVAEDDSFLASAYRIKLSNVGYEVIIVSDGEKVLQELGKKIPDILLLDLIMPGKDGFETLKDIRPQKKYEKLPIIVASNLGQSEDIQRAKQLGATDYIVKSDLSLEELSEKIKSYLPTP